MKELKHTPGSWEATDLEDLSTEHDYFEIKAGQGFYSHEYPSAGFTIRGFMTEGNAKLIAAAPDLLEALKICQTALILNEQMSGKAKACKSALEKAHKAITKATE